MLRDEVAPHVEHRNDIEQRRAAERHSDWTEKVYDRIQQSIGRAVDAKVCEASLLCRCAVTAPSPPHPRRVASCPCFHPPATRV
jgi:hypothetical protein